VLVHEEIPSAQACPAVDGQGLNGPRKQF
jgi:hypothetical protein